MKTTSPNSCKNGTIGCSAGLIEHTCHSQQKHCPNCISPRNWNCDCSCHTKSDWAEVENELMALIKKEAVEFAKDTEEDRQLRYFEIVAKREIIKENKIRECIRRHLEAAREEGRQQGLKEALGLVPEGRIDAVLEPFNITAEYRLGELRGQNTCRTAIINALEERMK